MVVIILATLAGLALPHYGRMRERRTWQHARDMLRAIYAGERTHLFMHNSYLALDFCSPEDFSTCDPDAWRKIQMAIPASNPVPVRFQVTVNNAPPIQTFNARAERLGTVPVQKMEIDETGDLNTQGWPRP